MTDKDDKSADPRDDGVEDNDAAETDETAEPDGAEQEGAQPADRTPSGKRLAWFAVYVYSGHERKVMGNLKHRIEVGGHEDLFGEVIVPIEEVTVQRGGRNTKTSRPFFPGYVLFQMVARDHDLEKADDKDFINATNLVLNTPGVRGFVGGRRDPAPLDDTEMARIMHTEESSEEQVEEIPFRPGDHVSITEGPFANFDGTVDEVIPERHKVKVSVTVFGRATPVEVDVTQLHKI